MTTMTAQTTQVYQLFIRATPEAIWDAITKSEFTTRYFFASRIEITSERRRSFGPNGEVWADSAVLEFDPPRRLAHGWKSLYDPELAEEAESRVTSCARTSRASSTPVTASRTRSSIPATRSRPRRSRCAPC